MSYDIIPLVITIGCLVGIIIIIVRKFPVLASIDIESIKSEREAKQKEKIIASRLERKVESFKKGIFSLIIPIILKIKRIFKEKYNKISDWEKRHSKKKIAPKLTPEEKEIEIKKLFFTADELIKKEKAEEAEKIFIEIISLDHKNIEAYKKLGNLYFEQKNYDYAIETLQYILKLNPRDIEVLIDLGTLLKQKGENTKALKFFSKAVELEPTKPKSLDFLTDISIIIGNKELAENALQKLREVNPENKKIEEFEERIKDIS